MSIEIIPALMPKTLHDLRELMSKVRGISSLVQLDVMDGKFVPNRSWPYHTGGQYGDDFLEMIQNESEGMPFWDEIDFEADLMISNPTIEDVERWVMAGAKRIILHAGSVTDASAMKALIDHIREVYPKEINPVYTILDIFVALHTDTPIEYIKEFAEQIDGENVLA